MSRDADNFPEDLFSDIDLEELLSGDYELPEDFELPADLDLSGVGLSGDFEPTGDALPPEEAPLPPEPEAAAVAEPTADSPALSAAGGDENLPEEAETVEDETGHEKKPFPLLLTVCAAVTLLCILILAVAFFRPAASSAAEQNETAPAPVLAEVVGSDYPESPEYRAASRWQDFRAAYDTDGSILNSVISSGRGEVDARYSMYLIYSQEMADELEKILADCNLKLWDSILFTYTADELYEAAGTGAFLRSGSCLGYVYNDGSFHFDGSALLDGSGSVNYSFDRQMRGSFSDTPLESGSGEDCQRWNYVTESGVTLQLSLGSDQCVVFASLPESYVSVTYFCSAASSTSPGGLSAAALEKLTTDFDWSQLS